MRRETCKNLGRCKRRKQANVAPSSGEIMYEALGAIYLRRDVPDRVDGVLYRKATWGGGWWYATLHLLGLVPRNETLPASNALNCHLKKETSLRIVSLCLLSSLPLVYNRLRCHFAHINRRFDNYNCLILREIRPVNQSLMLYLSVLLSVFRR
ncbi:hypothetical protein WA026_003960 [Henosepilachna vigintioctopunctata]|uniref:Uncharacterized protein n=1 Tax=Henosepilachna vigintioctopunctata TaxID=420089 RepID=A0AAW1U5Y8_9CUCU